MAYRVLFVDDDANVLKAISRQLNWELDITTAYSAAEGLALLEGPGHFDVVVTDLSMPGMNGLDFIVRAAGNRKNQRFIVLSGTLDHDRIAEAEAIEGVAAVLAKPTSALDIISAIQHAAGIPTA